MRAELDSMKNQIGALTEIMAKMQQTMEASLALAARNDKRTPTHPPGYSVGVAPILRAPTGKSIQVP